MWAYPLTSRPGTRAASSRLAAGTTQRFSPMERTASTDGRVPESGISEPSRPSSPRKATSGGT